MTLNHLPSSNGRLGLGRRATKTKRKHFDTAQVSRHLVDQQQQQQRQLAHQQEEAMAVFSSASLGDRASSDMDISSADAAIMGTEADGFVWDPTPDPAVLLERRSAAPVAVAVAVVQQQQAPEQEQEQEQGPPAQGGESSKESKAEQWKETFREQYGVEPADMWWFGKTVRSKSKLKKNMRKCESTLASSPNPPCSALARPYLARAYR